MAYRLKEKNKERKKKNTRCDLTINDLRLLCWNKTHSRLFYKKWFRFKQNKVVEIVYLNIHSKTLRK